MKKSTRPRYQLGELIASAYDEAQRTTPDPQMAARLAIATILDCLTRLGRPDLARQLVAG